MVEAIWEDTFHPGEKFETVVSFLVSDWNIQVLVAQCREQEKYFPDIYEDILINFNDNESVQSAWYS